MVNHNTTSDEMNLEQQGSILRGILGSIIGMFVCILVMLLCGLFRITKTFMMFQLFVGLVIGQFYRLFHGRRSKIIAYVTVGTCTGLACALWVVLLALLPAMVSSAQLAVTDLSRLWNMIWELLLLCVGLGLIGFFLTRRSLLAYADWKRGPWHIAYAGGNGALYNLLPEKLPSVNLPARFAVHSRAVPGTQVIIEGNSLRWRRRLRKDRVFSVRDIAGVVLGPGNGCNVLYGKDYQILAKFAGSMEHADLMFLWLLQKKVPIVNAPAGWRSPAEDSPEPEPVKSSSPQQQFTLRLKRSARIGFAGMGWFVLLIGLALFLTINFFNVTVVERRALIVVALATMGVGVVCVRIGTVCQVGADGEQIKVVSRFGRTKEFSVKEVSSVSRSMGYIVLYDKEFKALAKIDPNMENLDKLKEYFAFYGIKM